MNCPNCSAPLKSDERFCQFCGSENPGFLVKDTGIRIQVENRRPDDVRIRAYAKVPSVCARNARVNVDDMIRDQLVRQIAREIVEKKGYRMATNVDLEEFAISVVLEVTVRDYSLGESRA